MNALLCLILETDNDKFVKYLYHNTTSYNIYFICVFGSEGERKTEFNVWY